MCTEDYYKNAINFITKKVKNPIFFTFSDDMEWVENNIDLNFPTVPVNINGVEDAYEELRLMMACKHFIIANSSFSWRGAWLSNNPHKYVIAPTPWFNTFTKQGVLCPDWIHLKCDRSDLFNKSNFKVFELVSDEDLKKIDFTGFFKSIGEFGSSLISNDENSKIRFLFDEKLGNNLNEYIIEFKLFSNKKSLIKINYGEPYSIALGYNKGYSKRYLHLSRINLNDLILNINDDSLIIENITIKSVDSRFKLILK